MSLVERAFGALMQQLRESPVTERERRELELAERAFPVMMSAFREREAADDRKRAERERADAARAELEARAAAGRPLIDPVLGCCPGSGREWSDEVLVQVERLEAVLESARSRAGTEGWTERDAAAHLEAAAECAGIVRHVRDLDPVLVDGETWGRADGAFRELQRVLGVTAPAART